MGQELTVEKPLLVDTDVLVDFLRGYSKAVGFVNRCSAQIILSSIVVAELYAGVKGDMEETSLDSFIIVPSFTCNWQDCQSQRFVHEGLRQVSQGRTG